MSSYKNVSAEEYIDTAVRNASNPAVSGKRAIERRSHERRKPISPSHGKLEKAVDAALGEFIPAHEIYNDMRMHALAAIIDKQLYKADQIKDRAQLELVAQSIQAKQPRFRNPGREQTVDAPMVAGLYRKIEALPASALLGHRWEETKLDGNTYGTVHHHNSLASRHANRITDAIMPASPYYNNVRENFFELVRAKGATVKNWLQEEARIREEKLKPDAPRFISNKFFHHNKSVIDDLDKLLLPHKRAFEAEIPPSKPISPESLVRIGKLMVAHHRTWVPVRTPQEDGQTTSKIPRLNSPLKANTVPDMVPSAVAEASRHFQPDIAADRPKAIDFVKRFLEQVDSILPPTASNFVKRRQLGKRIFAAREKMISSNSAEQAYRAALGNPESKKNEATRQHLQTVRDMAETCERFVAAYEGKAPGFGLDADSAGPTAPERRANQKMTAGMNAIQKAGTDERQLPIKAFFTPTKRSHAEMESQTEKPVTNSLEQGQTQRGRDRSLKRPPLLDPRSRIDERSLSR